MKMRSLLVFLFLLISSSLFAQNQNLDLLGQLEYQPLHNSQISDLWGYTDGNGNEYAIVGVNDTGVSIVDVSNPSAPVEVHYSQGPEPSVWRDVVTYNDHAYIVNEEGGGMRIIDMSPLPGSSNLPESIYTGGGTWSTAHNLFVDEDGRLYVFGADRGNGGVIMLDLTVDPMNPVEVGEYDPNYVHDGFVRGDTLYSCHINAGEFRIVDVSDPANPQTLASHSTPDFKSHNAWLSDGGDELFVTDEVSGGNITSYDVSDPSNIQELDRIQATPGSGSIPHNVHFLNDYLVTSYYRDGVTIHDVSQPGNMVEVARYDTDPALSGEGFQGAWGAYPWLPSENIIASDVQNGLFVLDPTYERGCYLEGTVSDANTGAPINGVEVRIEPDSIVEHTDITGSYASGIGMAGDYDLIFSEPTYFPDTLHDRSLYQDSTIVEDIQLDPRPRYDIQVEVEGHDDNSPIEGAMASLEREGPDFTGTSDGSGIILLQDVYHGEYSLHLGKWGHLPYCRSLMVNGPDTLQVELKDGYGDDMALDMGWTVQSSSNEGQWERGEPQGTFFGPFTIDPDEDVEGDCGTEAYVTGNQAEAPGEDQVDTLSTTLRSPKMDLSGWSEAYMSFHYWFVSATASWNVNDDDTLFVRLEDGSGVQGLDTIVEPMQGWQKVVMNLSDRLPFSDSVQIGFEASDPQGNTVTEAGIDHFRMQEDSTVGIELLEEKEVTERISVHPNPFSDRFTLEWEGAQKVRLRIFDIHGRLLLERTASGGNADIDAPRLPSGVHVLSVTDAEDGSSIGKERIMRD